MWLDVVTRAMPIPASMVTTERKAWRLIAIVSLVPAVSYLLILALALIAEVHAPVIWLLGNIFSGPWGIPFLWLLVIGGPVVSVIGNLILQLSPQQGNHHDKVCGVIAWIVLVVCSATCLPFPWIMLVGAD